MVIYAEILVRCVQVLCIVIQLALCWMNIMSLDIFFFILLRNGSLTAIRHIHFA